LNCRGVLNEISDYLDGSMDTSLLQELEIHLSRCNDCRVIIDTTRKTIDIFCNSEPVPLPSGVRQRLHEAVAIRCKPRRA
jgi:predicted anti-sigma-YlaC factor YlaD